jgi:DNA repair protein RecO (recombination protein O)
MNQWHASAVVLSARTHGENGLIINLLTEDHGRMVGYMPGGASRRRRLGIDPGALVEATWQARLLDQMGTLTIEPAGQPSGVYMHDPIRLAALASACALCDTALPEREPYPGLYYGFSALMTQLGEDMWGVAYVAWEIALMKELGFALDFTRCAGGGDAGRLRYLSPKTGVAVSEEVGLIYKHKLLLLPEFMRPDPDFSILGTLPDIAAGLAMTGHFLEHWVFNHHRGGVPEARLILADRVARAANPEQTAVAV